MPIILGDTGADAILKKYFNGTTPAGGNNLTLRLYTNDYTPVDTSTAGSFTEAAGGGYAAKTLTAGSWTVSAGNDPSDATYASQSFIFTGALTGNTSIYGYYVVDADNVLIWAERLTAAFTPTANNDQLDISPKFQLSKGTPT